MHSESIQRLDADANRFEAVIMSTTTGGHPLRNFTSGNQESLRIQKGSTTLQSRASKHWQAFYTPSQMTVVVWGRENLEVLNSWACELFDDKSASVRFFQRHLRCMTELMIMQRTRLHNHIPLRA